MFYNRSKSMRSAGVMDMGRGSDWCIVRASGPRTLSVAASLSAAGYEAWTPTHTETRRRGRARERVEVQAPIMPTFVFVRAMHLPDIAAILASPIHPHPPFSLFRWGGRIPLLGERDIANLRAAEERARKVVLKKSHRHVFSVGQHVRVTEGVGAGMNGIVEAGDGSFALVAFGGSFRMKIATFLLGAGDVHKASPIAA